MRWTWSCCWPSWRTKRTQVRRWNWWTASRSASRSASPAVHNDNAPRKKFQSNCLFFFFSAASFVTPDSAFRESIVKKGKKGTRTGRRSRTSPSRSSIIARPLRLIRVFFSLCNQRVWKPSTGHRFTGPKKKHRGHRWRHKKSMDLRARGSGGGGGGGGGEEGGAADRCTTPFVCLFVFFNYTKSMEYLTTSLRGKEVSSAS